MFYDTHQSFSYLAVFWTVVTLLFGVSLHIALKLARIELELAEEVVVILVSSLTALVPVIGPYLAFIIAIYLIYRMADASLGMVIAAVLLTRVFAVFFALVALKGLVAVGLLNE